MFEVSPEDRTVTLNGTTHTARVVDVDTLAFTAEGLDWYVVRDNLGDWTLHLERSPAAVAVAA